MEPKTHFELHLEDCITGMRKLSAASVDLIVTSPPYNLGIRYGKYKDDRSLSDYLTWSKEWAREVKRVMKEDGSFFLNIGACPSNPLLPHQVVMEFSPELFVLQNTFHWIKSISVRNPAGEIISAGHFKPLQSPRYVNDCHEFLFHLTHLGETPLHRRAIGVPYADKSNIARWSHTQGNDTRCRGNNWFIPYKTILSRALDRPHPATFPTELALNCIRIHGCRPDLVMLDPFLGIGHSAAAAKECEIGRFIGFEIDDAYLEAARQNIFGETSGQMAPLIKAKEARGGRKPKADFTGHPTLI